MTGGELQLVSYGEQDHFLTGNPQISYFKMVYRRYTNFATESIKVDFEGNDGINVNSKTKMQCKIPHHGDLVSNIYFSFTLPAIYSSAVGAAGATEFKWVKNIGTNMIDNVSITIGNTIIDKHYGEWLNIWDQISGVGEISFSKIIGNKEELYEPKSGDVGNGTDYPTYSGDKPSIHSYNVYVPLIFWFNRNPGLALPLLSLQYHDVYIKLELHKILDLYTIIPSGETTINKPTTAASDNIGNFLSPSSDNITSIDINPHLEINYVFLSQQEKNRFAGIEHEYLIETNQRIVSNGHNTSSAVVNLPLKHPVKEMIWIAKRDDLEELNIWTNYTNWISETKAPYGEGYDAFYNFGNRASTSERFFPNYDDDINTDETDFAYLKKDIITDAKLMLNGMDRIKYKSASYFQYVQSYQHYEKGIGNGKDGINLYSFSLHPSEFQPSGSCNMSKISEIKMLFKMNPPPLKTGTTYWYNYNIHIYTIRYNILRITGGMGSLEFSN